jgi:asparagine synthase (glutamine-hydrolysing)
VRGLVRDGYLSALGAETYAQWQDLDGAVAHPFLDRRLVEYALVVPAEQRIAGGLSKVLLRQAMGNRLPRSVADRRDKAVLSSTFDRAVRGPQRDLLHEGLERARPVLDQLGRRAPDVETDLGTSSGVFRLYRTAIIGHWTAGLDDYSALPWVHKPSPSLRKGPT